MKKLIALALAAVLLLGVLAGCAEKDEKKIVGTWTTTEDMTQELLEELSEGAEGIVFDGKILATVEATFTEDGHVTAKVTMEDTEQLKALVLAAFDAMLGGELGGLFGEDMTTEEILASVGLSLDDMVQAMLEEIQTTNEDTYTLSEGKILYGNGDTEAYHFDGSKLVVDKYTLTKK